MNDCRRKDTELRLQSNQSFLENTMWQFISDLFYDALEDLADLLSIFDGYIEDDLED